MPEIRIIEKAKDVSWETIHDVLQQAHKVHFDVGLVMHIATLTADEMRQRVEKNSGKCYVAMEGDRVVGTSSIIYIQYHRWYNNGRIAELTMQGVLPSYQGMHLFSRLTQICEEDARKHGVGVVCFDTPIQNKKRIRMGIKTQYRLVDYHYFYGHYSAEMVKWFDPCPFSRCYCAMRYQLKKGIIFIKHLMRPNANIIV